MEGDLKCLRWRESSTKTKIEKLTPSDSRCYFKTDHLYFILAANVTNVVF